MKKLSLLMFVFFVSLVSCSSYHVKMDTDPILSPDSTTQLLRNMPMIRAAKSATFLTKDNIGDLINFVGKIAKSGSRDFSVISNDLEEVVISKLSKEQLKKLASGKIFVEIQEMRTDVCPKTISIAVSESSVGATQDRINVFRGIIEDELITNGFNVAKKLEDADYKMKVIVFEDGITVKTTISVLFSKSIKTGALGLDIKFIDTKTNETVLSYITKNKAYLNCTKIFYFIPVHSSSENLEMEY